MPGLPDDVSARALQLRAYFASVIGTFRAPFGSRKTFTYTKAGQSHQIARNTTADKVLSIFVSRNDLAGAVASTFSQQSGAATTDFAFVFDNTSILRFILYPSESLSLTINAAPATPLTAVVSDEAY